MGKPLSELAQSAVVGLPEREYRLCLASKVVGEVQSLLFQLDEIRAADAARADGNPVDRPRRAAESSPAEPIRLRLAELQPQIDDATGVLTLRGIEQGPWQTWCDAHPARDGNVRDDELARGYCNIDDLIQELGQFMAAWDGEPIDEAGLALIMTNAHPGDLSQIASVVVNMQETVVDLPFWLSSSLGILGGASD